MTAFAMIFERDRLVVCTDTIGYLPPAAGETARPLGFVSKLFMIPHLRAVAFARGMQDVAARVAASLMIRPEVATIEDAADLVPALLVEIGGDYRARHQLGADAVLVEFCLAGWSARENRMRIWYFDPLTFAAQDDGGAHYGVLTMPNLGPLTPDIGGLDEREKLVALMQAERRLYNEQPQLVGGAIIGGELVSCTIDPMGVAQRVIYSLPDYAELTHAASATRARIGRGDLDTDLRARLPSADGMKSVDDLYPTQTRQQRRAAERAARKARAA